MSHAIVHATDASLDRRHQRREAVERILDRCIYLARDDQLLIEQVYRHGIAVTDLARLELQLHFWIWRLFCLLEVSFEEGKDADRSGSDTLGG